MRYTARYARLARVEWNPAADRYEPWPTDYSPIWETVEDGNGHVSVYDSEAEAVRDAVSVLTDRDRLPYTEPAGLVGWGHVVDVQGDGDLQRYAVTVRPAAIPLASAATLLDLARCVHCGHLVPAEGVWLDLSSDPSPPSGPRCDETACVSEAVVG